MTLEHAESRIAELEEVLTLICGAFPTQLIGSGDPHIPNAKVRRVCDELRAKRAPLGFGAACAQHLMASALADIASRHADAVPRPPGGGAGGAEYGE